MPVALRTLWILILATSLFGCEVRHRSAQPVDVEEAETQVGLEEVSNPVDEPVALDPNDDRTLEQRLQDASLAAQVKLALAGERALRKMEFEPEVRGGVVVLQGEVSSRSDYALAAEVARRVPGVRGVQNQLQAPDVEPAPVAKPDTQSRLGGAETTAVDAARMAENRRTAPADAPPRATEPATQTATDQAGTYHTVSSGESLWTIAQKNGTTVDALRRLNNLSGDRVRPGQRLRVK